MLKAIITLQISVVMGLLSCNHSISKVMNQELAIKSLVESYEYNMDLGQVEKVVKYFANDGTISSPAGMVSGTENIKAYLTKISQTIAKGKMHKVTSVSSHISGDSAQAITYVDIFDSKDTTKVIHTAKYNDKLRLVNGLWKFEERLMQIDPDRKKNRIVVLFGGSPDRREEVVDLLAHIENVVIHGTLSEQEGMNKIEELGFENVALVLIGGRYTSDQRMRIKTWLSNNAPQTIINEPGVGYPYSNQNIYNTVKAALDRESISKRVLVVGRHKSLMERVLKNIESEGYSAKGALSDEEAKKAFTQNNFDAVIIGGGVGNQSRSGLKEAFRLKSPDVIIIDGHPGSILESLRQALK